MALNKGQTPLIILDPETGQSVRIDPMRLQVIMATARSVIQGKINSGKLDEVLFEQVGTCKEVIQFSGDSIKAYYGRT